MLRGDLPLKLYICIAECLIDERNLDLWKEVFLEDVIAEARYSSAVSG